MSQNESSKSTLPRIPQIRGNRYRGAPGSATLAAGEKLATAGKTVNRGKFEREKSKGKRAVRVGSVNVGTMNGRLGEVAEMLRRRRVDFCCLQETRWKGEHSRTDGGYKFFWKGCKEGTAGVGMMVAEKWVKNVLEVKRVNERIMVVRVRVDKVILNLITAYAPQVGRKMEEKEEFYIELGKVLLDIPEKEMVMLGGDLNGHVGEDKDGFEGVHGGKGYGNRNEEGEMILEFAVAHGLVVMNTCFEKEISKKVTYESGDCRTVVDYILVRQRDRNLMQDVKVVRNEPCIPQHKLMVGLFFPALKEKEKKADFISKCKTWRLKETETRKEFEEKMKERELKRDRSEEDVETIWKELKGCLLGVAEEVCGSTRGPPRHKESWWWNDECSKAVEEKRRLFGIWQESKNENDEEKAKEDKSAYTKAKNDARRVIGKAKETERSRWVDELETQDAKGREKVFKMAKILVEKNKDVVGGGCIKDEHGKVVVEEEKVRDIWAAYYEKLLNEEFDWNINELRDADAVSGPLEEISMQEVGAAIYKMKSDKATGPTGVAAEMLKAAGESGIRWMTDLLNAVVKKGNIPEDWSKSWMVSIYKGKEDALDCNSYRGIKLLEHAMKVFERIIEARLRKKVEIDDMQFGFREGKSTTDAIFIVRQLQEKYLEKKRELWMAFIDLEKAFDRVPREVIWWALRESGVEEGLIAVIKSMYCGATTAVKIGVRESKKFPVRVGVHQGSVLSPFLFITVLEALSKKFRKGLPFELLYADDLVLIAETEELLVEKIEAWRKGLEAGGLRVNFGKTKIMRCKSGAGEVKSSGKYPCGVCKKGVGRNSIQCSKCKKWIHKKCSKIRGKLKQDPHYICPVCSVENQRAKEEDKSKVKLKEDVTLDCVENFCYLGDVIGVGGGAEDACRNRVKNAWMSFNKLQPILTTRGVSLRLKGKFYRMCVQRVMVYGSETWPMRAEELRRLERAERMMIRWMCGVTLKDRCKSEELRKRLDVEDVGDVVRNSRLRWFGHLERKDVGDRTSACRNIVVAGNAGKGRPKKRWMDGVEEDLRKYGLDRSLAKDRDRWRAQVMGKTSDLCEHGKTDEK